ncbi:MAG: hypothetical protein ACREIB_01500 [Pseudomonadota bacterium]
MKTNTVRCTAPGCTRPAMIRKHALCLAHYQQMRRYGTVVAGVIQPRRRIKPYKGGQA